ncbi:MAG: hypothetical protein LBN05_01020 [Oscillospiraceae bacterium]|jgi:hypothetical protein|nr:hypothetical protein [Oscillospiraceae bacterium]
MSILDKKKEHNKFLQYKGKPLVRSGNQLYYGEMNDPSVVFIQVLSTRNIGGMTTADKVNVQLVNTDPDAAPQEQILRATQRRGLYDALDVGLRWMETQQ